MLESESVLSGDECEKNWITVVNAKGNKRSKAVVEFRKSKANFDNILVEVRVLELGDPFEVSIQIVDALDEVMLMRVTRSGLILIFVVYLWNRRNILCA